MSQAGAIRWTEPQQAAIRHRHGHLVVSASAGAGKTAVLAERVFRLVTEEGPSGTPPPRLDQLLVITFTDKAARQMRERIERRLREGLVAMPESRLVRQALDDVGPAWIMTIHAFCRRVLVEHFHRAGLPPSPRVPDGAELIELELDAIEATLEGWAGGGGERRAKLAELLGGGRGERDLTETVRSLIRFLDSLDRPDRWRAGVLARIEATLAAKHYGELPEAGEARQAAARGACELAAAWRELLPGARAAGADPACLELWDRLAGRLEQLCGDTGPLRCDAIERELAEVIDPVLLKLVNKGVCGGALYKSEFSRRRLEPLCKAAAQWRERWFELDEGGLLHGARLAARRGQALLELAGEAAAAIERHKRRRGLITFNDFERQALAVLSADDGPSEIAELYRDRFAAVLVDEYQDTSPLQDAIVRLVARDGTDGRPGNLFLVGDYKQSIYRFRHADPLLFRSKLEQADPRQAARLEAPGFRRIDLQENFRSRPELIEFVNSCFERLIDREIGEVTYGERERLRAGLAPDAAADPVCVEAAWLPRGAEAEERAAEGADEDEEGEAAAAEESLSGLEAQAAWVARRIRALIDGGGEGGLRPGDFAILLRSVRRELDMWVRALAAEGLPARAPGIDPLFSTQEMLDLMAALRVADNPLQDVPLATLMRSPMGGFSDDELLEARLAAPRGPFHEAVWKAAGRAPADPAGQAPGAALAENLRAFLEMVDGWRTCARQGEAGDVLARILAETAYDGWLAGRPGAMARLENLEHLRRLAARCGGGEAGANSLGRLLELIDRAAATDQSDELPETVGDAAAAVHLMSIHRSKGLEFPVVVLPRLERRLRHPGDGGPVQVDREAGLALIGHDPADRRIYHTLAWHRLRETLERKDRSEELRLLYVAMTRARSRLILVGQVDRRAALAERWAGGGAAPGVLARLGAGCYADLIGPILQWHASGGSTGTPPSWLLMHEGDPPLAAAAPAERPTLAKALARTGEDPAADWRLAIEELSGGEEPPAARPIRLLPPLDPLAELTTIPAKTTVTQLRRARVEEERLESLREEERFIEAEMLRSTFERAATLRRPEWLAAGPRQVDAALRGSWTHALLARVPLTPTPDAERLRAAALELAEQGLIELGPHEPAALLAALDFESLAWFFTTEPGRRMCARPGAVSRELPFSARRPVFELAPRAGTRFPEESFLLQGTVDVIIDEGDSALVLDYKTDRPRDEAELRARAEAHRLQVTLYARCLQSIWKLGSVRAGLVFLHPRRIGWVREGANEGIDLE